MLGSLWFNSFSSGAGASSDYELISTTVLGSTTASVTFNVSSYASTYKHLQLRIVSRNAWAAPSGTVAYGANALIRFNGDSTSGNYRSHYVEGNSASGMLSGDYGTINAAYIPDLGGVWDSSLSGVYSAGVIDILDPFSATKNKTLRTAYGNLKAGQGRVGLNSTAWFSTSAVTSIVVSEDGSGGGYKSGTRFSLYGLRG